MTIRTNSDLRRLTSDLETVADWKEDLASWLRRAELQFEFVDLDADELDALTVEVAAFNQVCLGLVRTLGTPPERKVA